MKQSKKTKLVLVANTSRASNMDYLLLKNGIKDYKIMSISDFCYHSRGVNLAAYDIFIDDIDCVFHTLFHTCNITATAPDDFFSVSTVDFHPPKPSYITVEEQDVEALVSKLGGYVIILQVPKSYPIERIAFKYGNLILADSEEEAIGYLEYYKTRETVILKIKPSDAPTITHIDTTPCEIENLLPTLKGPIIIEYPETMSTALFLTRYGILLATYDVVARQSKWVQSAIDILKNAGEHNITVVHLKNQKEES